MSLMNIVENGAVLTKNGGCSGCPDATGVSNQQVSGSGAFQFSTDDATTLRFVGLSGGGIGTTPADVQFAIRLQAGVAEVRESGAYKSETPFGAGDTFTIALNNGSVTYAKNGTVFYTSATPATIPLRGHLIFFDVNASVRNVSFGSGGAAASSEDPTPMMAAETPTAVQTGEYAVPRPPGSTPVRRRR